ncbi:MAG TPA: nucleotidyltransferase domain-containing protein [Chitinophagaceae bacterium]|nr:nucleotidyltransferase domain-containing protein [Chitinophagaceae bacterium]
MKFGLTERQFHIIEGAIDSFKEIEKAIIFGSRAQGNFKASSDIDLAIIGKDVTSNIITKLSVALDELPVPFMFDILDYKALSNKNLKNKIDSLGKIFFERKFTEA